MAIICALLSPVQTLAEEALTLEPLDVSPPEGIIDFLGDVGSIRQVIKVNEHIHAYVVASNETDQGVVVFADPGGQVLISGMAIDLATGVNLAQKINENAGLTTEAAEQRVVADALQKAENLTFVSTNPGAGDPIYILVDFACGYCHQLAQQLESNPPARELRWVPVGLLGQRSKLQAAALLALPPERQAPILWELATGRSTVVPENVTERQLLPVLDNEVWAEAAGLSGTPSVLLNVNGEPRRVVGLPQPAFWDIIAP
jgi:hypothetical protein